jgi:hypothetical protein
METLPAAPPPAEKPAVEKTAASLERSVLLIAVMCSVAAGALHFAFAPGHFDEYWLFGTFFLVSGWLQILWGLAAWHHPRRWLLLSGAGLQIAVVAVWVVSRTVGVPFGPEPGVAESVGFPDTLASALEVLSAAGALVLALYPARLRRPLSAGSIVPGIAFASVLALTVATGFALTPRYAGEHHDGGAAAGAHNHSGTSTPTGQQAEADGHVHTDTGATAAGGTTDTTVHDHTTTAALTGDTPCEKSGPPASEGSITDAEGHAHRGPTAQIAIDFDTRMALEQQQVLARAVATKYPTVADAEKAGYHMSTPYVPCIGAHYTNVSLVATFDPSNPSELLYDGTTPDARIVGLSFLVYNPGGEPAGFAGPNDHWHQHNANGGLCFGANGVVIGAEDVSVTDCAARGGHKATLEDIWMVHDWIVPGWECTWGVFAPECPELGGTIGASAWD